MPNWCNNYIEVKHSDAKKITSLRRAFVKGNFCNFIIPTPKHLTETVAGSHSDPYDQELLEFREKLNVKYYGSKNWYDFQVEHWGTKWDCGEKGGDNRTGRKTITLTFDSAWSPPIGVYEAMLEQGYEVVAYYYEPGMAYVGKWDNGEDNCVDLDSSVNSANVRFIIGDELDDMFGISDSMSEYEQESEEEELTEWIREGAKKKEEA